MRLNRRELIATGAAGASLSALPGWAQTADPWAGAAEILARIRRPRIPARSVSIVDYGAKGDGVTLNSRAFAGAWRSRPGVF
jgi:polygalacturonase